MPDGPQRADETEEDVQVGEEGVRYREVEVTGLVTPPVDKMGRRIRYCILEVRPPLRSPDRYASGKSTQLMEDHFLQYSPLIDSSNVSSKDWIRLATDISLNYGTFDGFLLLHGTDTMAHSASALRCVRSFKACFTPCMMGPPLIQILEFVLTR